MPHNYYQISYFSNHMQLTTKILGLKEVAHLYTNYFFDLDGVLWKGDEAVPGSFEILNHLRSQKKNLYFITNSSLRGREELAKKFSKFNFKVDIEECFPSAYISVLYLKQKYPHIKKIMTFGSQDMAEQFKIHGFDVQHVKTVPNVKAPIEIAENYLDLSVQAIVVGWDPEMTFSKLCLIGFHIQNGIKLFGTNPDKYTMIGSYKVPGPGSIIASIETGFNTKAEIIGKPNTFMIDHIIESKKLDKGECIMVGDNRETDISFGNDAGIATLCVLSGVTERSEIESEERLKQKPIPTYYSHNLCQ